MLFYYNQHLYLFLSPTVYPTILSKLYFVVFQSAFSLLEKGGDSDYIASE